MQWKKIGKIFDPTQHKLPNNCFAFAQSPQALVFDNFIRIYFSTRQQDGNGKFLSHIAFVDFTKNFDEILNISSETVIALGSLGCFDEHGIFPINLLKEQNRIIAYTCGWSRRVSVSVETSTGLAFSDDNGVTFKKYGEGPIMGPSLSEPFLVGDAFVKKIGDKYHMWYIFGTHWAPPTPEEPAARVYKIGHAFSNDGIEWTRENLAIIKDRLNIDECQALPTVIELNGRYHMYFCFRQSTGFRKDPSRGYRLGYAYSDDLINWIRDDKNAGIDVTDGAWDSDMMCYPHLFSCDNEIYLLYNGNEFGKYGFGVAKLIDHVK